MFDSDQLLVILIPTGKTPGMPGKFWISSVFLDAGCKPRPLGSLKF